MMILVKLEEKIQDQPTTHAVRLCNKEIELQMKELQVIHLLQY
jgi:hypothetical protein